MGFRRRNGACAADDTTAWCVGYYNGAMRGYANAGGIVDGVIFKLNVTTGKIIDGA